TAMDALTVSERYTLFLHDALPIWGTDALVMTDGTNAWVATGNNAGTLNTTTTFSGITTLTGGTGTDTLTGVAAGSSWSITGANEVGRAHVSATATEASVVASGADK